MNNSIHIKRYIHDEIYTGTRLYDKLISTTNNRGTFETLLWNWACNRIAVSVESAGCQVAWVWLLGGVGLVAGWLLGSLVVVGSKLGSLVIIGSFGAIHRWAVLLALGMVMVVDALLWLSSPLW